MALPSENFGVRKCEGEGLATENTASSLSSTQSDVEEEMRRFAEERLDKTLNHKDCTKENGFYDLNLGPRCTAQIKITKPEGKYSTSFTIRLENAPLTAVNGVAMFWEADLMKSMLS